MKNVSIVIPVFNEDGSVEELVGQIRNSAEDHSFNYDIIFINDGSTDRTREIIQGIISRDDKVQLIDFRQNRGKAEALHQGFRKARGDYVITMDGDLQDDPEEIPALLAKIDEGWDLVSGWKKIRHDPVDKTLPSKIWNKMIRMFTGINIHDFNCGLKAYRREVVKSISLYGELHRYIPVLAKMEGYRTTEITVQHRPRTSGHSKYGWTRMFKGIFDLITVLFLGRFTTRPMHFFGLLGMLSTLVGLGTEIWVLILKYGYGHAFKNHIAMLIFGVLMLILGAQLFSMGLIGEMMVYQEKRRKDPN